MHERMAQTHGTCGSWSHKNNIGRLKILTVLLSVTDDIDIICYTSYADDNKENSNIAVEMHSKVSFSAQYDAAFQSYNHNSFIHFQNRLKYVQEDFSMMWLEY